MSLTKEDSADSLSGSQSYQFVRNSKLRQSIRIRDRANRKLPPSALIFMKTLEKNTKNITDPVTTLIPAKVEKPKLKKSFSQDIMEISDYEETDEAPLIRRMNSKRSSFKGVQKTSSVKKHKKLNRIMSFFR